VEDSLTTLAPTEEASAIERRRKRHILRVVATVISEEGFSGATMRKIAERAGVSTGMLTYYYKNKREMLQDVLASTYSGFIDALSKNAAEQNGPDRVFSAFEVMLSGSSSGRFPISFWLAYFAEAMRDEELRITSTAGIQRLRSLFRNAIDAGIESGELRPDLNNELIADLLMTLWQGIRVEVGLYGMDEDRASDVVIETLRLLRPTAGAR
jgi:AcrR family transcriptional regulator